MANQYGGYQGSFVPSTNVWDTSELEKIDVTKPEFRELLVRLYQNLNLMAQAVNLKDTGYYYPEEFVNGQKFFPNPMSDPTSGLSQEGRQVFRTVINFGALPNTATKSVAHGIPANGIASITRIYGAATNTAAPEYIPIPYVSVSGANIELYADGTNVYIITNADYSAYTITYVIMEYLKQ
jgi:hypothetical protein